MEETYTGAGVLHLCSSSPTHGRLRSAKKAKTPGVARVGARQPLCSVVLGAPTISHYPPADVGGREVQRESSSRRTHKDYLERATALLANHRTLDHTYGVSVNNSSSSSQLREKYWINKKKSKSSTNE